MILLRTSKDPFISMSIKIKVLERGEAGHMTMLPSSPPIIECSCKIMQSYAEFPVMGKP